MVFCIFLMQHCESIKERPLSRKVLTLDSYLEEAEQQKEYSLWHKTSNLLVKIWVKIRLKTRGALQTPTE